MSTRPQQLSHIPELRALQLKAGPGVCPLCLRPLKKGPHSRRGPFICWSADCRTAEERIRFRNKLSKPGEKEKQHTRWSRYQARRTVLQRVSRVQRVLTRLIFAVAA